MNWQAAGGSAQHHDRDAPGVSGWKACGPFTKDAAILGCYQGHSTKPDYCDCARWSQIPSLGAISWELLPLPRTH